ncbi:MAG: TlpA disulfide reductase family protein [Bacteroidota bacterium]
MIQYKFLLLFVFINLFGHTACKQIKSNNSKISIVVKAPAEGKIYLVKIGLNDENEQVVDSSVVGVFNTYTFTVKKDISAFYQVKVPFFKNAVYVIPDADVVDVKINLANNKFSVEGSNATGVLYEFYASLKSLNANELPGNAAIFPGINKITTSYTFPFMDTVSSPATFMVAYNTVEFGKDYATLKAVVDKAAKRFPSVGYIIRLKEDAYKMIDIFEKEFNVNDLLPSISLGNIDSIQYSTASLKGKYYLINFWSTWCEQCFSQMDNMKKLYPSIDTLKLSFVSTAVDNNRNDWKNIIQQKKYNWTNLIDEKMWKGDAVNTLKFDSIPFSFLVSPEGKVLAKAIPPDSLQYYLSKYRLLK